MGLGLEALGISADDMTPAEAAELSRLLKQVKQLEAAAAEKDSGGRPGSRNGARARQQKGGGAIPALITSASAKEAAAASPSRARSPAKATTRPAYPSVRIGQSARAYAERQRLARAGEAQRAEHGDGDDFGGKRAAPRQRPDVATQRGPLARLSEYEADALASYKRVEEAEVGHLVALLIGTAANDVTFGALVSALKVAARGR
ncbi:hypothetical protein SO694_000960108 [Aureococcus anophagefferens]|uniref:ENT domain-containing protein n=1 Tax=Aureococcus anophagefferens TaxID=44056 RepID=A0ABR1FSE5_AURAN